jgi:hypothetical protein
MYKKRLIRLKEFCLISAFAAWTAKELGFDSWQRHTVQTGSGTHPASYPMVNEGSFPEEEAAGV